MSRWRMTTLCCMAMLVLSQAELQSTLDERADFNQFSGTADQILRFDPHDYVPSHYSLVRVAHAALMSAVFLVIFPLGGMIPRLSSRRATTSDEAYRKLMWLHATLQMIGFWIVIAGAGMGIWMGKEIDQLTNYHPIIGMIILVVVCFQPLTEIINHRFYHINPRVIYAAHIHIWSGRALLVAGVVQGGLGLLFAASFENAVVDLWPRVAYGLVAGIMWIVYMVFGVILPEIQGARERKEKRIKEEAPLSNATPMYQQPTQSEYQQRQSEGQRGVNEFLYARQGMGYQV